VGAPGLVNGEGDVVHMGDLGELRDPGDSPEVGGRDDHCRDRLRRLVEGRIESFGGDAVGDPELGVDLGLDEAGAQPGEDEAVDGRGVDVALDDHVAPVGRTGLGLLAGVGEGHAGRVVAA
jgi:hypothetical protein